MPQVNLLRSLPKTKRNIEARKQAKDEAAIAIAREFGAQYFDGPREYGYGGYHYDGRWRPVADDIRDHYKVGHERVLDVGCAKGFLVHDLYYCGDAVDPFGLDVSSYALQNCHPKVIGRLHRGCATSLPFPDKSFKLALSINTLHNLELPQVVTALQELTRVSRYQFVQVDSYETPEQKALFEDWVLTAKFHGYPHQWLDVFHAAGYEGDWDWTIV